jgi:hypothetical protein
MIVAILFIGGLFVGWLFGFNEGISYMERKAVRDGKGEFYKDVDDEDDERSFRWKGDCELPQNPS